MAISIKTAPEIEKMRRAGRLAAEVLEMIEPHVIQGITTDELDRICTADEQHPARFRGPPDHRDRCHLRSLTA